MQSVEITKMESFHREFVGSAGAHAVIDLSVEDVAPAVKKELLYLLDFFTTAANSVLSEGGTEDD